MVGTQPSDCSHVSGACVRLQPRLIPEGHTDDRGAASVLSFDFSVKMSTDCNLKSHLVAAEKRDHTFTHEVEKIKSLSQLKRSESFMRRHL